MSDLPLASHVLSSAGSVDVERSLPSAAIRANVAYVLPSSQNDQSYLCTSLRCLPSCCMIHSPLNLHDLVVGGRPSPVRSLRRRMLSYDSSKSIATPFESPPLPLPNLIRLGRYSSRSFAPIWLGVSLSNYRGVKRLESEPSRGHLREAGVRCRIPWMWHDAYLLFPGELLSPYVSPTACSGSNDAVPWPSCHIVHISGSMPSSSATCISVHPQSRKKLYAMRRRQNKPASEPHRLSMGFKPVGTQPLISYSPGTSIL